MDNRSAGALGHLLNLMRLTCQRSISTGQDHAFDVPDDMPLLWVLRDVAGLTGTKFGCGVALCGCCTVHLDGPAYPIVQ